MAYSAKAIANYFLDIAESTGHVITPMKLQKLVYFAHGWNLAITAAPLIDEQVEAWQFGPVISSLYHAFKKYGGSPITGYAKEMDLAKISSSTDESSLADAYQTPRVPPNDHETIKLLSKIWEIYGTFTAVQLSNLTHLDGTPWKKVWDENQSTSNLIPKGKDIDNDAIKNYFLAQAKR